MKVLVLIISSDTIPVYELDKQVWRSYMHLEPEIDSYFLQMRIQSSPLEVQGDTIWIQGEESFKNITRKTLDALQYCLDNQNYDFVVRTNLSSVWNYKALLRHLRVLLRTQTSVYSGCKLTHNNIPFISGAGIIMNIDVARLLINSREKAEMFQIIDDVDFGFTLHEHGVPILEGKRTDLVFPQFCDTYKFSPTVYHYRIKQHDTDTIKDRRDEPRMMQTIVNKILQGESFKQW